MDDVEQLLKKHYQDREMKAARVESVLQSCEPAREIHRWRRRAMTGFGIAAAALIGLLTVLSGNPGGGNLPGNGVAGTDPEVGPDLSPIPGPESVPKQARKLEIYRLIAVKIHADPCERCKQIEPVFAGLQKEFLEKPVLFMTFDHTSKRTKRQAELLSRQLGIEGLFKERRYTGVIVLATPEGEVQEVVSSSSDISTAAALVERSLEGAL